eukprot:5311741-Prymnesium_polylepis.2
MADTSGKDAHQLEEACTRKPRATPSCGREKADLVHAEARGWNMPACTTVIRRPSHPCASYGDHGARTVHSIQAKHYKTRQN